MKNIFNQFPAKYFLASRNLQIFFLFILLNFPLSSFSQWKELGSFYEGGIVDACSFNDTLFVLNLNYGPYLTTDNGEKFESLNKNITKTYQNYFNCIFVDSSRIIVTSVYAIYISTDRGKNWKETKFKEKYDYKNIIKDKNGISINAYGMVYQTVDNGKTWKTIYNDKYYRPIYNYLKYKNNLILLMDIGYAFSTNNGLTWNRSSNELNESFTNYLITDSNLILFSRSANHYAIIENPDSIKIFKDLKIGIVQSIVTFKDTLYTFQLNNKGDSVNYLVSGDKGKIWLNYNNKLEQKSRFYNFLYALNGQVLVSSGYFGIYFQNTGDSFWTLKNNGIIGDNIKFISKEEGKLFAFIDNYYDFIGPSFLSYDFVQKKWESGNKYLERRFSQIFKYKENRFLVGEDYLMISDQSYGQFDTIMNYSSTFYRPYLFNFNNELYLSTDFDIFIFQNGKFNKFKKGYEFGIFSTYEHGEDLICGTYDGPYLIKKDFSQATLIGKGKYFTDANFLIGAKALDSFIFFANVFYSETNSNRYGYLYRGNYNTLDGFNIMNNLKAFNFITDLEIINRVILVATEVGMYYSTNLGESFKLFTNGIGQYTSVNDIESDSLNIYISTAGDGVFYMPIADLKGLNSQVENNFQTEAEIFPNPSTEIINIKMDGMKKIELFSINGILLKTYDYNSTQKEAINISKFPKGIYILKIYSKNGIAFKKIVHL